MFATSCRRRTATGVLAASVAAWGALSTAASQTSPAKVRVGNLKFSASVDLWLAQRRGMFSANGLDVSLTDFRNGQECVSALQSNSVDICLLIPGIAMQANERGFGLVVVAQNETAKSAAPDSGSIAVLKDSPYKSLADLAGRKISTSGLHGQQTVAAQLVLKRSGVDLSTIQLLESPTSTQPDLLKSKQVDAIVTVDPYTTLLQTSGLGRVLSWHFIESVSEQPIGAWFSKGGFVKSNPGAARRFAKTMREAIEYVNADEQRTRADVAEYTGLSLELLKAMPLNKWDYRIQLGKWQGVADMLLEMGELQSRHKPEEYLSEASKPDVVQ